jgi:isopenicillin N synthase-like dioxygenase
VSINRLNKPIKKEEDLYYILSMVEAIPEINIASYLADPTSVNEVIQNIYDAASNWSFFILSGTYVSPKQQSALVESANSFSACQ